MYIYIYIHRERERCVYVCIYIYIYTYIYIYIYIHTYIHVCLVELVDLVAEGRALHRAGAVAHDEHAGAVQPP